MKKINWIKFHLHCRNASELGMTVSNREVWVPSIAKSLANQDLKDALNFLTKAASEIGYSLIANSETLEPNSTRIVVPLDEKKDS